MTPNAVMGRKILGELVAENDERMLGQAFYETQDYKSILQIGEYPLVIGRRGTGKSAIVHRLRNLWREDKRVKVVDIFPAEAEMYGLRAALSPLGPKYTRVRAATRLAVRYGLLLEVGAALQQHYKVRKMRNWQPLSSLVNDWRQGYGGFAERVSRAIRSLSAEGIDPDDFVRRLSQHLLVDDVERLVREAVAAAECEVVVLVDRLDEGYEPDELHAAAVGGVIMAAMDLNSRRDAISAVVLIRDNMFRGVFKYDPDYARNIEGRFIRLHWSDYELLNLVCNRIRVALELDIENSQRIWDRFADAGLQGSNGFARCLRYTLYRPRDLLSLLNDAYYSASKAGRTRIIDTDLSSSAKSLSIARLDDLVKEYEAVWPGMATLVHAFEGQPSRLTYATVMVLLGRILTQSNEPDDGEQRRGLSIMGTAEEAVRVLYGVGFLGVRGPNTATFQFCHDGRSPERQLSSDDVLLVHPCYQMALSMGNGDLSRDEAEQVDDDYVIDVSEETAEHRTRLLGQHISALDKIPPGSEGAKAFEEWCWKSVQIAFGKPLRHVTLHPNRAASSRRDVVGTVQADGGIGKRIYDDYGVRHLVFEVKNYEEFARDDVRQMLDYMSGMYGRLAFLISRDISWDPRRDTEIVWIKELYAEHNKLLIKLTAKFFVKILSKLRNPDKMDPLEDRLGKLLDMYHWQYLHGQGLPAPPGKRPKRRKR